MFVYKKNLKSNISESKRASHHPLQETYSDFRDYRGYTYLKRPTTYVYTCIDYDYAYEVIKDIANKLGYSVDKDDLGHIARSVNDLLFKTLKTILNSRGKDDPYHLLDDYYKRFPEGEQWYEIDYYIEEKVNGKRFENGERYDRERNEIKIWITKWACNKFTAEILDTMYE